MVSIEFLTEVGTCSCFCCSFFLTKNDENVFILNVVYLDEVMTLCALLINTVGQRPFCSISKASSPKIA